MTRRSATSHQFDSSMCCRLCGLGFSYRLEACEGATDAGRMELRRRIAAETKASADRQAKAAAEYFAQLRAKRAKQGKA